MKTRDQKYMNRTEIDAAVEYAEIARTYDVPVTLFVTGRTAVEETDACRTLSEFPTVEVGGHNHRAYTLPVVGSLPYNACFKAFGVYSPAFIRRWDVQRALSALRDVTGQAVVSWRDHAYRQDRNTTTVLSEEGIQYFSDEVTPDEHSPYAKDGLIHVPINTLPDHEHLYHGFRTREYVEDLEWENAFTNESFSPQDWVDTVLSQVQEITDLDGTATILAHPGCMDIADGLSTFEKLCSGLSEYETVQMRDVRTISS